MAAPTGQWKTAMTEPEKKSHIDWRIAFGFGITVSWISAGLFYLVSVVGLDQFVHLPTADIGSFLEGAFAPLAFLWLVIGHFMQQREITGGSYPYGLQLILDTLPTAVHYGDSLNALNLEPALEQLRKDIQDPAFIPRLIQE